jgi:TonB family protein
MTKATARQRPESAAPSSGPAPASRKQKVDSFLVTSDDELWSPIGAHLTQKLRHRQIDSVEELIKSTSPGDSAVVLWDARGCTEPTAVLARLQAHSPRFAIVALEAADRASAWSEEIESGQLVGVLRVPIEAEKAGIVIASACEEANARTALLGEAPTLAVTNHVSGTTSERGAAPRGPRLPLIAGAGLAALAAVLLVAYVLLRHGDEPAAFTPPAAGPAANSSAPAVGAEGGPAAGTDGAPAAGTEDKVDALIAQAQRAMRDRHFIEPAEGSALSLYRSALVLAPASGEAQQGLKRLAEVLVARVQTALDEKQYEAALQALETVRNIDAGDPRLPALDERIAKMRDELGPAEIQAAINAQNFDRAAQLIDQATRAKTVSEQKLVQIRDDLRRHRIDGEVSRLITLAEARLSQDQLVEPLNDSAEYYLAQARKAGASTAQLQPQVRELVRRLTLAAHTAIDQRRLADADRLAADLQAVGAPLSSVAAVQRDIGVARAQPSREQSDTARFLDLAKSRLAQGSVIGPENDSALYYLGRVRASDPQNAALPELTRAVQTQIIGQASDALDAGEAGQSRTLLELGRTLGPSADIDALTERLRQGNAVAAPKEVAEASLTRTRVLNIEYPDDALRKKIEGSVEIGFVVSTKGIVSDIKVLDSNPGGVFEKAATRAVEHLRYRPVMEGGKAVAVSTKMLVIFRLAK